MTRREATLYLSTLAVSWLLPLAAVAQADGQTGGFLPPGASETPALPGASSALTVINAGDLAPFSGLLLSDERYAALKMAELEKTDAEFRAEQERRTRADLQVVLDSCLLLDEEDGGEWYETFWAGAVFGVGAAILVGWLGYKVIE